MVANNQIALNGAAVSSTATYGPGASLQFVTTFSGDAWQHVGLMGSSSFALFSTFGGGSLYARTSGPGGATDSPLAGNWLGASHLFRIDWNSGSVNYFIDGVQVASHQAVTVTGGM